MQKEITQDFYPHRRDDDSYANLLPDTNPTYPTQGEIAGLLENVSALTQQAEGAAGRSETAAGAATDAVAAAKGHADNAKSSADAAGKSAATAEDHAKKIEQTKTALTELKGQVDQALINANGAMGGAQTAQQETQRLRDNVAQLEAAAKGHADHAKSSADAAGQSAATAEGQANRAGQLKTETETLSNQIRSYVDNFFPAKVQSAETMINGVVSDVRGIVNGILETTEREVTNTVNGATSAINSKATSTIEEVEGKRQAAVTTLEMTKDEVIEAVGTAKREAIESVKSQANHAVQSLTTTLTNAQTEINGKVEQAKQAKDNAATSASNAKASEDKAKEYAEQAAAAQQSAEGLAERLEDLHGVSGSPSVSFRDVGAELYAYGKWDPAVYTVELLGIHSTDRGNLICVASCSSSWMRLYVIAPNGEVIANQSLGSGQYTATFQIVRHGDRYLVLLNSACYAVTEKVDDAGAVTVAITSLGAIDFDGYGTSVGAYSAISTVVIGDRAILGTLVLDLINLKVVQKLSASVSFARGRVFGATDSVIATLSNGTMTQLSLDADGLVVCKDYMAGTSVLHKNSCILDVSNISGTTTQFALLCATPSQNANLAMFSSYSTISTKYQQMTAPVPVSMTDLISRGRVTVAIGVDGLVSIFRFYGVTVGQRPVFGRYVVQFDSKRRPTLCGIDEKGVWLMNGCAAGWGGYRPTQKLTRIEW